MAVMWGSLPCLICQNQCIRLTACLPPNGMFSGWEPVTLNVSVSDFRTVSDRESEPVVDPASAAREPQYGNGKAIQL